MRLALCDKVLVGDVPEYDFKTKVEAIELLNHWLENKKYSVFVCFQNWNTEDVNEEQQSLFISHNKDLLEAYAMEEIEAIEIDFINLSIFEFEDYENALQYCLDLKEGL